MDYFAHESNVINNYQRLLHKVFRRHKPNECLLSSAEFIDRGSADDKLTTEESKLLEAAHNFIMLRIEVAFKEKSKKAARKATKNAAKKDVGKRASRRLHG